MPLQRELVPVTTQDELSSFPRGKHLYRSESVSVQYGEVPGRLVDSETGEEVEDRFLSVYYIPTRMRHDRKLRRTLGKLLAGLLTAAGLAFGAGAAHGQDTAICSLTDGAVVSESDEMVTAQCGTGNTRYSLGELYDGMELRFDTELELEAILSDVTDVFTNNDGALTDDDLSDNTPDDMNISGTPGNGQGLGDTGVGWTRVHICTPDVVALGSDYATQCPTVDNLIASAGVAGLAPVTDGGAPNQLDLTDIATQAELDTHEGNASAHHTQTPDQVGTVTNGSYCQGGPGSVLDCDVASVPEADVAFATNDGSRHDHVEADIVDLTHFTPTAGIATDHGAGAVSATTDLAGALCGTGEILEDQGASWACITTPSGAFNSFDITDTDASPILTVNDSEQIQFIGSGTVSVTAAADGANHDVTIAGSAHFSPTAGISTDHGAGAITATTDLAGSLCGTNEILEDQGASWACIATPTGGGGSPGGTGTEWQYRSGASTFGAIPGSSVDATNEIYGLASTLDQATGNEVGLTYTTTCNKATSGDCTGFRLNLVNTATPDGAYVQSWDVGGSWRARVVTDASGQDGFWLSSNGTNAIQLVPNGQNFSIRYRNGNSNVQFPASASQAVVFDNNSNTVGLGWSGDRLFLDTDADGTRDAGEAFIDSKQNFCKTLFDSTGLADTDDITSIYRFESAATVSEVWAETDTGTATITLEDGAGNDLATSCSVDSTGDTGNTCTLTANTAFTAGELLDFVMVTAAGNRLTFCVTYLQD